MVPAPDDVTIPDDLAAALDEEPLAARVFDRLSTIQRREYVQWLEDAEGPDQRERRVAEVVDRMVRGGGDA